MRLIGFVLVLAISLTLAPLAAEGQQTEKVRRIGYLSANFPDPAVDDPLRQGLREHGYVEGQNLLIEWRFAEGRYDRLPSFSAELVRLKIDVIVTLGTEAALAAKKATAAIPIVFTQVTDPIASGLVPSLARPGGNLTGFSLLALELTGKRMEARLIEVRDADELEAAFTTMARERALGVVLVPSSFLAVQRIQIAELAIKRRLPVLAWTDLAAIRGALMSYGPSTSDLLRRAGGHVAKILNGAKPGDLPVEQPTKLELVINLKTAKTLGLTIPQTLLLRADQVIEQRDHDQHARCKESHR
jgi:putative tryptophan/tyrosine transport system substrate-binding protein